MDLGLLQHPRWSSPRSASSSFSSLSELIRGVTEGWVLGSFLFKINVWIYLNQIPDVWKHASLNFLLRRLEHDISLAAKCFDWIIVGHKHETVWASVGCSKLWQNQSEKLLWVFIDRHLNFYDNFLSIFKNN